MHRPSFYFLQAAAFFMTGFLLVGLYADKSGWVWAVGTVIGLMNVAFGARSIRDGLMRRIMLRRRRFFLQAMKDAGLIRSVPNESI